MATGRVELSITTADATEPRTLSEINDAIDAVLIKAGLGASYRDQITDLATEAWRRGYSAGWTEGRGEMHPAT